MAKQFCKHGHEIAVVGRDKWGMCIQCNINRRRIDPTKDLRFKQICINGHDTFVCGRRKGGACIECDHIRGREYYKNHKEQIDATNRRGYRENKEKRREHQKQYETENKKLILKRKLKRRKERRATDPCFLLKERLRDRFRDAIKNNRKRGSAVRDLGCSIEFLKDYIEDKFYDGMTWTNYGRVWELDHVVPLWKFDLTNKKQFLEAVHYTNLQPLTIADHDKKSAKEVVEFFKLQRKGKI